MRITYRDWVRRKMRTLKHLVRPWKLRDRCRVPWMGQGASAVIGQAWRAVVRESREGGGDAPAEIAVVSCKAAVASYIAAVHSCGARVAFEIARVASKNACVAYRFVASASRFGSDRYR